MCLPSIQQGLQLPYLCCCGYSGHCVGPQKRTIGLEPLINEVSDIRDTSVCAGHRSLLSLHSLNSVPVWLREITQVTGKEAQLVRHP